MVKLNCLKDTIAVKKFVLRCSVGVDGAMGVLRTSLSMSGGELTFEKQLTKESIFAIVSFEDPLMMLAWESLANMQVANATKDKDGKSDYEIIDIVYSEVIIVADSKKNITEEKSKVEEMRQFAINHEKNAAVLDIRPYAIGKYQVIMIFRNEEIMSEFNKTFGVQGQ